MTDSTPPAPGAPADGQPAPVATPPAGPPATPAAPAAGAPAPTGTQQPGTEGDKPLGLTQAELDRIIGDRLARAEQSWQAKQAEQNKKLAALLGGETDKPVDPADALKAAHAERDSAVELAHTSMAESLAALAGIRPDRVPVLAAMVDKVAALQGVDRANPVAVRAALDAAVQAKAAEFPEWKASALPASSGGDRQPAGDGKRIYTMAELEGMSQNDLAAIADDLQLAAREGRIK